MRARILKIAIAFDQFLDALGPASLPGVTISAHACMADIDGRRWGVILSRLLDAVQKGHCEAAMRNDYARAQAVIDEIGPYIDKLG